MASVVSISYWKLMINTSVIIDIVDRTQERSFRASDSGFPSTQFIRLPWSWCDVRIPSAPVSIDTGSPLFHGWKFPALRKFIPMRKSYVEAFSRLIKKRTSQIVGISLQLSKAQQLNVQCRYWTLLTHIYLLGFGASSQSGCARGDRFEHSLICAYFSSSPEPLRKNPCSYLSTNGVVRYEPSCTVLFSVAYTICKTCLFWFGTPSWSYSANIDGTQESFREHSIHLFIQLILFQLSVLNT